MTSDRDAIINAGASAFQILKEPQRHVKRFGSSDGSIKELINDILLSGIDITKNYKQWYEIGCALANEYGEGGRNDFHLLSRNYPSYKQPECDRQFDNCIKHQGSYTIATLFYYARQSGISIKGQHDVFPIIRTPGFKS